MNNKSREITLAYGDGIGPEIMDATINILKAAEAKIHFDIIEVGKNIYEKGFNSGLMPSAWESLNNTKILLKAPITTPQGGGYKSLNVTIRKKLGLYANVRPVKSFYPYVQKGNPNIDVVIIRENEEDLYSGVEYRSSPQIFKGVKIISQQGCEKIIRYAFEYAIKNNRKHVSCFSKDNIMKICDGSFHAIFNEIAKEYPKITSDHHIIDIATAKLAAKPENFDVIVTLNLYGDIISDVAAEISGSVGMAGSANIGDDFAMFEAIHGSAPTMAGENRANPSGLINAAIQMLVYIDQADSANLIQNAFYRTLEDGIHTADIYSNDSKKKVGTKEFAEAVIDRLGQLPQILPRAEYKSAKSNNSKHNKETKIFNFKNQRLLGADISIDCKEKTAMQLNEILKKIDSGNMELKLTSVRGLKIYPYEDQHQVPNNIPNGHFTARFLAKGATGRSSNQLINENISATNDDILKLIHNIEKSGLDFTTIEKLYSFDNICGYTACQGE